MLAFLTQIVLMVSLGTVVYIVARALPRISDRESGTLASETHWLSDRLEKLDGRIKRIAEKSLRRSEVVLLKLENIVHAKLQKIKKESPNSSFNGKSKEEA